MIEERRAEPRGRVSTYANPFYRALRASAEKADTLIGAVGIFLVAGLIIAAICTAIFVSLASHVRSGSTQAFDDAVIGWIGAHRSPGLDAVMVEVTTLGTGIVVMMIVAVSSSFPSGHAMSAAVVYSTVAYLAARLHKRRWAWRHWRLSRSSGLAAIPGFCRTSSPLRSRLRPPPLTFTNVAKLGHFH